MSFFEHDPVPSNKLRPAPSLEKYLKEIQKTAASMFPLTFLNNEKIVEAAGGNVLSRIRSEALVWIAGIALLFTILQQTKPDRTTELNRADIDALRTKIELLQDRILKFEEANSQARNSSQQSTSTSPPIAGPSNE